MNDTNQNDTETDEYRVVVESGMGPAFGYYHRPEVGTRMGSKEMSRDEAEELGYSRCISCYPNEEQEE